MRKHPLLLVLGILVCAWLAPGAAASDVRQNVLVNGSKYQYESFVKMGNQYIQLFGLGMMIRPDGEVPGGLVGSAAAIFSTGYQAKARMGLTGPQEVLMAKEVKKMWGQNKFGSGVKSEVVDKSKLKPAEG